MECATASHKVMCKEKLAKRRTHSQQTHTHTHTHTYIHTHTRAHTHTHTHASNVNCTDHTHGHNTEQCSFGCTYNAGEEIAAMPVYDNGASNNENHDVDSF